MRDYYDVRPICESAKSQSHSFRLEAFARLNTEVEQNVLKFQYIHISLEGIELVSKVSQYILIAHCDLWKPLIPHPYLQNFVYKKWKQHVDNVTKLIWKQYWSGFLVPIQPQFKQVYSSQLLGMIPSTRRWSQFKNETSHRRYSPYCDKALYSSKTWVILMYFTRFCWGDI